VSRAQLLHDEKQARECGEAQAVEVLQQVPKAHGAQGDEVICTSASPLLGSVSGVPPTALAQAGFARGLLPHFCSHSTGRFGNSFKRLITGVPITRVGVAGLSPAEPERGRVWEPSQGSMTRVGVARLCLAEPERGRVWEPSQGSHYTRAVAPMVEQRSPKPRVVGSSPSCPAKGSGRVGSRRALLGVDQRGRALESSQGSFLTTGA